MGIGSAFDRGVDKFMAGEPRRRVRYVMLTACVLLALAGYGLWLIAFHTLELKIYADGPVVVDPADPAHVTIALHVDGGYFTSVATGQPVRVHEFPDATFRVTAKGTLTREDTFTAWATAHLPPHLVPGTKAITAVEKAYIVYRQDSLLNILISP